MLLHLPDISQGIRHGGPRELGWVLMLRPVLRLYPPPYPVEHLTGLQIFQTHNQVLERLQRCWKRHVLPMRVDQMTKGLALSWTSCPERRACTSL